jgi:hypothetical protein
MKRPLIIKTGCQARIQQLSVFLQKLAGTLRQLGIWAVQAIQSERIWSEMQESGLETVVGVDAEAEDGCDFHRLVATQGGLELPTAER